MALVARLALTFVLAAVTACGASTDLDQDAGASSTQPAAAAPSTTPPSLVGLAGTDASRPRPVCTLCTADGECGAGAACVASPGGGFCAPGCSKEGFCTPDRMCTWVTDEAGKAWAACLPLGGKCDTLQIPAVRVRAPYAGTW